MALIPSVRGFKDILPDETGFWRYVEDTARDIFTRFGFREIRVPILEKTELFKRGIGDTTDIVEKEMYTFEDRGGESLTLRPEATAPVIRSYLEHHLYQSEPVSKLYTIGPMFRRERPQKGRFRQFHQVNVEVLGSGHSMVDAELLFMLVHLLEEFRLPDLKLEINSLGCPLCRPLFKGRVLSFLEGKSVDLCADCRRRLRGNPLRVFDCKNEECRSIIEGAPMILDSLCEECIVHFDSVRRYLERLGVDYTVNGAMVRGLDYYRRTAFEVTSTALGAQNAIAGGGRYDGLTAQLGGPDLPGIGFAIGMERLISLMPAKKEDFNTSPLLYIAALGPHARERAFLLANVLRKKGIVVEMDYSDRGLKGQMKRSDKLGCRFTLIIGDDELVRDEAPLRDMKAGGQRTVSLKDAALLARELAGTSTEPRTSGNAADNNLDNNQ